MKQNTVIARRDGASSTGTPHSLLVEQVGDLIRFTVLGADGKKRHASVNLPAGEAVSLVETLQDFAANM